MPSTKRSAETPVEELDDELRSPSNRSRVSETGDAEEDSVKQEPEQEMEEPEMEDVEQAKEEDEEDKEEEAGEQVKEEEEEEEKEQVKEEEAAGDDEEEGDQVKEEDAASVGDGDDQQQEEPAADDGDADDQDDEVPEESQQDEENDEMKDQAEETGSVEDNDNENDEQMEDDAEGEAKGEAEDEDAEDEDAEGEDGEDEAPVKRIKKINQEGRPAEAGVISRVYVENFMCHQKLKVDLCRNVNFIHGQNGSGKSAILAAIQICLGANARRTHRARNIKDLVRKEAAGSNPNTSAKVRVTLLNGGEDGYRPDLYGDKITVERSISLRGGYNGYKLLDSNGKEVSRKKCDLDDLLDYLNIQVDNPVAILDQEEAKKFLTGKASDKHAFFMKATELERIDKVFAGIMDRALELEGQKKRLTDSLEGKSELAKTLKKRLDQFQAVEQLEQKRLETEVDYAWAFYGERDGEYQDAAERMEAFQKKAEQKQQELTQAEEEASGANDGNEEKRIRDKMQELQNEANGAATLKRDLTAEAKLAQNPVKQIQHKLKHLEGEKKTANQQLSRAKKRLKETREEIMSKAGSAESEEAKRAAELNEVEEALTRAKAETDKRKEAQSNAYRDWDEKGPELEQAKQAAASTESQCRGVRGKLGQLTSSATDDPAAIFGNKCSQIAKLVEKSTSFKDKVIGPIGVFLKIAPGKEQYAELAEGAIGHGTLDRFIVTNDHDRKEFQKLRKQLDCKRECSTIQVKVSRRFNVPPPPSEEIETVASVLTISDDVVFNALVDTARIDQRALAPSKEISEQHLLISDPNGRYDIKGNITEVTFLPKGDKWTVRNGSVALTSNDRKGGGKKIGVDRSEAIKEAQAELRQLETELKELKAVATDKNKESHELKKTWNICKRAERENQDEIQKLTRKKEEIENEMETTANTSIDTTEMEEDVSAAEDSLATISDQKAELKKELESLQPAVEEARKRLEEVQIRNEKVLQDMKEAEESLEACMQRQTQSELEIEKKRVKVQKYNDVIKQHQSKVDEAIKERDGTLLRARKLTLHLELKQKKAQEETEDGDQSVTPDYTKEELEQVEICSVPREAEYYLSKVKKIKLKIGKEKERRDLSNEDPTEANEKYHRAKDDLLVTQAGCKEAETLLANTEKDLRDRQKRWSKLRRYLERMTDSRFDEILRLNKSCGSLEFDDETKELNLVVQKNVNDPDSQTKDVKALSGGERSYTTISLLLALGESLETPFRVLDEFDVFLDPQARKLTIQTLIHVAKKMEHRQFIFITPQDLSSVRPDDKVKIFQLKPPERNLRAGGPTQQTLDFSQG